MQLPGTAARAQEAYPDGDGLVNLIEYGLGQDPSTPGKNPLLELLERRDAIVIGRQRDLPGTALVVEYSRDLQQWE